jgi:hypothetical protein
MIVAAHQPNYLPWLGFFDKLRRCDRFLILDHVQFERQNFQNRTRVRFGDEARWLTVPVVQRSRDELILDKLVDNGRAGRLRWGRKQFATLEQVYRGAPYFRLYAPALRALLDAEWEKLIDLNVAMLRFCMDALDIRTPLTRTSEMGTIPGQKSELVLNMCKAAGADVYLSGDGASRHYLDIEAFRNAGVEVRFQEFRHPDYPQGSGKPLHGLSVLDLLFHCGPLAKIVLSGGGIDGLPAAPALGVPLAAPPFLPPAPAPSPAPPPWA